VYASTTIDDVQLSGALAWQIPCAGRYRRGSGPSVPGNCDLSGHQGLRDGAKIQ
jgi:hypothetical protein